jgi:NAD-dependent dihydropyrimidine dehydrogenase PreA subunit
MTSGEIRLPSNTAGSSREQSRINRRALRSRHLMAYIITEPCIGVKDKSCVTVCPVDCIHEGVLEEGGTTYDMLFINPDECIDCGNCASICAQNAIYPEADLPADKTHFAEKNRAYFQ